MLKKVFGAILHGKETITNDDEPEFFPATCIQLLVHDSLFVVILPVDLTFWSAQQHHANTVMDFRQCNFQIPPHLLRKCNESFFFALQRAKLLLQQTSYSFKRSCQFFSSLITKALVFVERELTSLWNHPNWYYFIFICWYVMFSLKEFRSITLVPDIF